MITVSRTEYRANPNAIWKRVETEGSISIVDDDGKIRAVLCSSGGPTEKQLEIERLTKELDLAQAEIRCLKAERDELTRILNMVCNGVDAATAILGELTETKK